MDTQSTKRLPGRVGLAAGVMLLLMAGLAAFGYVVAVDGLITPGDAVRTTHDLLASRGLFAAGILCLAVVLVLDVLVAWTLYLFFKPVNRAGAMLAAMLRTGYAALYAVALSQLVVVLRLLDDGGVSAAPGGGELPGQVVAGIGRFTDLWNVGLILFGLSLLVLGWLGFTSGTVPKLIGVLLAVAGVGYVLDSAVALASPGSWTPVSTYTFVGELVFALWLVSRGRRARTRERRMVDDALPRPVPDTSPAAAAVDAAAS